MLVVTEKCGPSPGERDGGARLVATLLGSFGDDVAIMQFGPRSDGNASWHYRYPIECEDRFARRLANGSFIAQRVREVAAAFSHVVFVHVSMQFGFGDEPLAGVQTWTFPMFLTPSYLASGEVVPLPYTEAERAALSRSDRVLTPSHLERRQLVDFYSVPEERVRVVPRGVVLGGTRGGQRTLHGALQLCSVGTIKRQKNTRGLVRAFAAIRARHPSARLRIIGGVQDQSYAREVDTELEALGVASAVELVGYVPPEDLPAALADAHLHLSASSCETFGRAIFETLALGLPNAALLANNAAAEYLLDAPYARFVEHPESFPDAVDELLVELPARSRMALEVAGLFDESMLSRMLSAELRDSELLGVSDWDGTLFHGGDQERTQRSIAAFRRFNRRVVATARTAADALAALRDHQLEVDWLVACSGAVICNGRGEVVWRNPLQPDELAKLEAQWPDSRRVMVDGETVQLAMPRTATPPMGHRVESYLDTSFVARWDSSKLRGVLYLLRHLDWEGRVRAFGDGRYDEELLVFFDGTRILGGRPDRAMGRSREAQEIGDAAD